MCLRAKFCDDQLNSCRFRPMTVFRFFTMMTILHLGFVVFLCILGTIREEQQLVVLLWN